MFASRRPYAAVSDLPPTRQSTLAGVEQAPDTVDAGGDLPDKGVADLFPAYDDDRRPLLVLTRSK
jgi:hypothetical protein